MLSYAHVRYLRNLLRKPNQIQSLYATSCVNTNVMRNAKPFDLELQL